MEAEKPSLVPNQFFDLIARIIPGAILIFLLKELGGFDVPKKVIDSFVPVELREEAVPWLVVMIGLAFALGHLLSPLVKVLDHAGRFCRDSERYKKWYRKRHAEDGLARMETLYRDETRRYNVLRFRHPSRIVYATRIRAEAAMYGGIAAAAAIGGLFYVVQKPLELEGWDANGSNRHFLWILLCSVLAAGMVYRYYDLHTRFCKTIAAFEEASENSLQHGEPKSGPATNH